MVGNNHAVPVLGELVVITVHLKPPLNEVPFTSHFFHILQRAAHYWQPLLTPLQLAGGGKSLGYHDIASGGWQGDHSRLRVFTPE